MKKLLILLISLMFLAAVLAVFPSLDTTADDDEVGLGDVNGDGAIDQFDYILVKRAYFETIILTDEQVERADINADGVIDQFDYILIARHYFGSFRIGIDEVEESSEIIVESSKVVEESSVIIEESSEVIVESSEIIVESSEVVEELSEVVEESSEVVEESSEISIEESSEYIEESGIGDAEMLPSGYLMYKGAVYSTTSYKAEVAQAYADVYAKYARKFPDVRISVINHPLSAINITNPDVRAMVNDQGEVLDLMESHIYGNVNFVNLKDIITAHRGEYLYFKSDYHWTQRGAYYAYYAFAESLGITPTPLSEFEEVVVCDDFIGRVNDYAHDDRILSFYDTIYAYMPTNKHTMTIYDSSLNEVRVFNNSIYVKKQTYSCFIYGDQPYTVINVPSNPQDKNVIVIKDSSANAFVPFLTEHYGNVIVIDPRHISIDISRVVKEYDASDIIFFATASTSNRMTYCEYYESLLG